MINVFLFRRTARICAALAAAAVLSAPLAPRRADAMSAQRSAQQNAQQSSQQLAQMITETPRVSEAALSPDGRSIAYSVTRKSVAKGGSEAELLLQRLDENGQHRGAAVRIALRTEA